jgi:hypothetical protein
LDGPEITKFTLKGTKKMISRSRFSKPTLFLLINKDISFIIFWEADWEAVPLQMYYNSRIKPSGMAYN